MIKLDNLKAGDLITIKVAQDDVDNLTADMLLPRTTIFRSQIISISHPPKPLSDLQKLKVILEGWHNDTPLNLGTFRKLLDILISKESGYE